MLGCAAGHNDHSSWRPLSSDLPPVHHSNRIHTYGALATPIAFLLFAFFLGFAIMIGAELNAAIEGGRRPLIPVATLAGTQSPIADERRRRRTAAAMTR